MKQNVLIFLLKVLELLWNAYLIFHKNETKAVKEESREVIELSLAWMNILNRVILKLSLSMKLLFFNVYLSIQFCT